MNKFKDVSIFTLSMCLTSIITLLAFTFISMHSFAQSFKSGNHFDSIPIYGEVTIQCSGPMGEIKTNRFSCQDLVLSPTSQDYFIVPDSISGDADKITLSVKSSAGKWVTKESPFQSQSSQKRFNLWLRSLFQTPLLEEGVNHVIYTMMKGGVKLREGAIDVDVVRGPLKRCPNGYMNSGNLLDCDSPFTVCQRYFQEYQYCYK